LAAIFANFGFSSIALISTSLFTWPLPSGLIW
jgi:hypothetical protein